MIEVAILVPIMWIVMSALYMFLLKNIELSKKVLHLNIILKTASKELQKKTEKNL